MSPLRLTGLSFVCALAALSAAPAARAAAAPNAADVEIVKVQGAIDPAQAAYVRGTIEAAATSDATVILQLDSRGSYGGQAERLAAFMRSSSVPVVAWVGQLGAHAEGGALFLLYGSDLAAMAPGAGVGPGRPLDLSGSAAGERAAEARLVALAPGAGARTTGVSRLIAAAPTPAGPALAAGDVALVAPDIPDLLRRLDGRAVRTASGTVVLRTVDRPGHPVTVGFHEIGPVRRVLHGVSTPGAVYVLIVLGVMGIAFEVTQPALGIAGIGGVLALALAGYGLAVVPVSWPGLALVLGGMALQGLDVVIRRVAWLTAAGTVAFAAGSVIAWHGVAPPIRIGTWVIVLATIATFLFFGFVLTVALRSRERIRSAQVGLVGLVGEVRTDLDPEGGVYVKGTLWRARSSNGRIPKGTRVRVRAIDGLILRVEQEPEP